MRDQGFSLRDIGHAAELSPEGVRRVLGRKPRPEVGRNPERQLRHWTTRARNAAEQRARLLLTLHGKLSERQLAQLSGLSRTAVRYQLTRAATTEAPLIIRSR